MEEINKAIIETCIKIARRGEGALLVLGTCKYTPLVEQDVTPFNILKNPKLLESLLLMDGAVVVKQNGMLEAYGVKIKSNNILPNFGTRHSAGISASINKNTTVYLVSEEERKVKIFKDGKMILMIDALEKDVEKHTGKINQILESAGIGTIGAIGASIMVPTLGIALIPGIIVFGSMHWIMKELKLWEKGK